jgi:L-2-hydroxyglutarate oxidase
MNDVIIIGGGIVGLATAVRLKEAQPGWRIILLEKENELAHHQTGNNSGVIHSGIYYKPGSLKALNCRTGYRMMLDFCEKESIPHELCGKLIIATQPEELPRLEVLHERGIANGLTGLIKISADQIQAYEPQAKGIAALWVPQTGIVDFKVVARRYAEIFERRQGGEICLQQKVVAIRKKASHIEVATESKTYEGRMLVNAAGLYSDRVATMAGVTHDVRIIPFRGEYYNVVKEKYGLVRNLIYPVPDPAFPFLGVHFTRRIGGGIEAGPNAVFALKREGYKKTDFSLSETFQSLTWPGFIKVMMKYTRAGLGEYYRSFSKNAFTKALQRLLPAIQKDDLEPGGAGVRAQACTRAGLLIDDFIILQEERMVHVLNAPSPAATSSLSIGKSISERVLQAVST